MLITGGFVITIPHTAEVRVVEHNTERLHGLTQNLLTMGDKEEMTIGMFLTITLKVESCDNSLSCSRSSYHQIAKMSMHIALYI